MAPGVPAALVRPECRTRESIFEQGFHNLLAADETAGINVSPIHRWLHRSTAGLS
jgi:hypothetical protein